MRAVAVAALSVGLVVSGCPSGSGGDGGSLRSEPDVTLEAPEANVIGTAVSAQVRVSSCKAVNQVQILESDAFLTDVPYTSTPTMTQLAAEHFTSRWPSLGFAGQLVLAAKVVCDGDRSATSPRVNVSFFPVNSRLSLGRQSAPDVFVAQGGLGEIDPNADVQSSTATFIGCVMGDTAKALAISNTKGVALAVNQGLPFACDGTTQISDRSSLGIRWVLQPGQGAYAIDESLGIRKVIRLPLQRMAVASDGTAVFWDNTINAEQLVKADPLGSRDWAVRFGGIMNADPVIDVAGQAVWTAAWQETPGEGDIVAFKNHLNDGRLLNGAPIIIHLTYDGSVNTPIMPLVSFSPDGSILYAPLLSVAPGGALETRIWACPTSTPGCTESVRKWTTVVKAEVQIILPYDKGNLLAALGPTSSWLLSAQTGQALNKGQKPIAPTEGLQILAALPGPERDLYLLDGPIASAGADVFPTEVVAIDAPETGELYRFRFGTGTSPSSGLFIGIDEAGQTWYRVGLDLVKPHPWLDQGGARRSWYRIAKGP